MTGGCYSVSFKNIGAQAPLLGPQIVKYFPRHRVLPKANTFTCHFTYITTAFRGYLADFPSRPTVHTSEICGMTSFAHKTLLQQGRIPFTFLALAIYLFYGNSRPSMLMINQFS